MLEDESQAQELEPVEVEVVEEAEDQFPLPAEGDSEGETEVDASDDAEEIPGEIVVTLDGDDEDGEQATPAIRQMRQALKEQKKRERELVAELEALKPKEPSLGEKPSLAAFDYDTDAYDAALLEWSEQKRKHDDAAKEQEAAAKEREAEYAKRLEGYHKGKSTLGAKDFDEVEEFVRENTPVEFQSAIVAFAQKPELVVYALGKNKALREDLNASKDVAEFAYKLGRAESKMRVTGKTKPKPERVLNGGAGVPKASGKTLEKLRAEAQATGDFSKVTKYRREMNAAKP